MAIKRPKGTNDYFGIESIILDRVINEFKKSFRLFGFEYIKTPTFEFSSLLKNKYGDDAKLIYEFEDKKKRKLALRYDLTVPLARVVGNNNFTQPAKFYNIGSVFRYDRPQKGRKREFIQADIDIIGDSSLGSDAELISCMSNAFFRLNLNPVFRVNNRSIMEKIFSKLKIPKSKYVQVLRTIDKLDKIGINGIKKELKSFNISDKKLIEIIKIKGNFSEIKDKLDKYNINIDLFEFEELLQKINSIKLNETNIIFDLSLARGLSYYTGNVWEIDSGKGMSIGGGGRYDNLIKDLTGKNLTGVGISVGITRLIEIMKFNKGDQKKLYVISIDSDVSDIVKYLRRNGINTSYNLKKKNIKSSINYAYKNNYEYVMLVGSEEIKTKLFTLKNINSGLTEKLKIDKIISKFK